MPKEEFSGKKENQFRLTKGTYKAVHMTIKEKVDDFTLHLSASSYFFRRVIESNSAFCQQLS